MRATDTRAPRRWIVKLGSAVTRAAGGGLDEKALRALVGELAALHAAGEQTVLVSSGAVAAGRDVLGCGSPGRRDDEVVERQVSAAVGQIELMGWYQRAFGAHGIAVAQVLATRSDFGSRRHYLNMRQCVEGLLARGIVPIVNENDVVSVSELMFTDNDELAGLLAGMLAAGRLVLLSNVDGVFDGPPDDPASRVITDWNDRERRPLIEPAGQSDFGRGGIQTKIRNAEKLSRLGTEVFIANGRAESVLACIDRGEPVGTRFPAADRRASGQRRWVAGAPRAEQGAVVVNAGAAHVLCAPDRLASLLPVGVVAVRGAFQRGDVIPVEREDGTVIAWGRAEQGADTVRQHLGERNRRPVIHYDYLYVQEHS